MLARVAVWSRPSLLLGEVMTEQQLACLVSLAVGDDPNRSPWACHAITCLLQDMLEGTTFRYTVIICQTNYFVS